MKPTICKQTRTDHFRARRHRPVAIGEAAQSASRQDPPELYGGGGRKVVRSAQEHSARLAESWPPADRRSATHPDPWAAARELSPRAPRAQAAALPARRALLFPLPGTQDLGSSKGRLSADHGQFWQSAGTVPNAAPACTAGSHCGSWRRRPVIFRSLPQAQQRIVEGAEPSVNCDLEREPDAQPGK